ncbi:MAG TPA: Uma2 family endonuclease [Polyangiaceae bacterium]
MLDPSVLAPEKPRRLKRSEYERLVELGMFEDERVELLYGTIVEMSPAYPEHAGPITQLNMLLVPALVGRAAVRVQLSLLAEEESVPEPALAIVPLKSYQHEHPAGALLVIEVASSSLRKDRIFKAPLYAASGVAEYWIVNVSDRRIEVLADSDGARYQTEQSYGIGEKLAPRAFPDVTLNVADVFA